MTTVVGWPAAAWWAATPLTASPSPPVRAKGQYSAVRWTTPTRSAGATGGRGAAVTAACRRGAMRRWDFGAGVVAPIALSMSGCRRGVRRRLAPHRGAVVRGGGFPHHALGGGPRARRADRLFHLLQPAARDTLGIAVVEQRHHLGFEQTVQLLGIGRIAVLDRKSTRLNSSH